MSIGKLMIRTTRYIEERFQESGLSNSNQPWKRSDIIMPLVFNDFGLTIPNSSQPNVLFREEIELAKRLHFPFELRCNCNFIQYYMHTYLGIHRILKLFKKIRPNNGPVDILIDAVKSDFKFFEALGRDYAERIRELCYLFNIELTESEFEYECQKYTALVLLDQVTPQLKLSTNYVFCSYFRVKDLPKHDRENDFLIKLFPRRLSRLLTSWIGHEKRMVRRAATEHRSMRRDFLINTLFQGFKRGLLPISPELVSKTLASHRDSLTIKPVLREDLKDKIHRICKDLLSSCGKKLHLPSTQEYEESLQKITRSATVESPYALGGNIGHMQRMIHDEGFNPLNPKVFAGYSHPKSRYDEEGRLKVLGLIAVPVYCHYEQLMVEEVREILSYKNRESWSSAFEAIRCCITEPFKVRIITKPTSLMHCNMHWLQKQLWEVLKSAPNNVFRLIGEEMTEEIAQDFVCRSSASKSYGPWSEYISGDFKSASDLLNGKVSRIVLDTIIELVWLHGIEHIDDPNHLALIMKSLEVAKSSLLAMTIKERDPECGTHLTVLPNYGENNPYSDYSWPNPEDFDQTNGQLMGNVLSFPILCIVNYIAYHISIEETCATVINTPLDVVDDWQESKCELIVPELSVSQVTKDYPVLINGDDILFRAVNRYGYNNWEIVVRDFGLIPSLGKNHVSYDMFMINSQLYTVNMGLVTLIPFLNFGFLTGRRKNDCSKDINHVRDIFRMAQGTSEVSKSFETRLKSFDTFVEHIDNFSKVLITPKSTQVSSMVKKAMDMLRKGLSTVLINQGVIPDKAATLVQLDTIGWILSKVIRTYSSSYEELTKDRFRYLYCTPKMSTSAVEKRYKKYLNLREIILHHGEYIQTTFGLDPVNSEEGILLDRKNLTNKIKAKIPVLTYNAIMRLNSLSEDAEVAILELLNLSVTDTLGRLGHSELIIYTDGHQLCNASIDKDVFYDEAIRPISDELKDLGFICIEDANKKLDKILGQIIICSKKCQAASSEEDHVILHDRLQSLITKRNNLQRAIKTTISLTPSPVWSIFENVITREGERPDVIQFLKDLRKRLSITYVSSRVHF